VANDKVPRVTVLCYTCIHFRGMDSKGIIHCDIRRYTLPMIACPHYRPREKVPHPYLGTEDNVWWGE